MPADWQQWYPHNIDAWQSSATIQTLTDAGYRAYHNLIQAQYQAEDGMLPGDEKELMRLSRMRIAWPEIRNEILACFQMAENGRVFSPRQHNEWKRAQVIHTKRVNAAKKTNKTLKRKRAVTVQSPGHIDTNKDTNNNSKEEKQKPSRAKRDVDERHTPFREVLSAYWEHKNPSAKLPWQGRDAKALADLLSASPDLTADHFRMLLRNRARSEVSHGERVYLWIAKIHSYTEPLNRFNKPETSNGTVGQHHQGAVGRVKRTGAAWDAAIAKRLGDSVGEHAEADVGGDASSGIRGGDNGSLPDDLRGSSPGVRGPTAGDSPPIVPQPAEVLPPSQRSPRGS